MNSCSPILTSLCRRASRFSNHETRRGTPCRDTWFLGIGGELHLHAPAPATDVDCHQTIAVECVDASPGLILR